MLNKLRRRFILFNMIVIGCVLIILTLFVLFKNRNNLSSGQVIIFLIFSFTLVYIGSFLISKFALKPIQNSWQKQLDFTADASHELRTPLAVTRTNLEIIMDNRNETIGSQMKWIKNIEAENIRMTKLVDDLLTLSRADTNQQNLNITTFMLDEAIKEVVTPFEATAFNNKIYLENYLEDKIAFTGDKNRIKQLIIILLDNAIKYTNEFGSINITLIKQENLIKVSVEDTGVGIDESDIDNIFNRFYRGVNTRKHNEDGTGLGLSIAKWIVDEHKGDIKVESNIEKGTKFIVKFPI